MNGDLAQNLVGVGIGYDYIDMEAYRSYMMGENPRFKTDALIFDQIAIPGLRFFFETYDYFFNYLTTQKLLNDKTVAVFLNEFYSEIEFLYEKGFFVDPYGHMSHDEWVVFRPRGKYYLDIMTREDDIKFADRMPLLEVNVDLNVVESAITLLNNNHHTQAIRLFSNTPSVIDDPFIRNGPENVLKIVINAVPSPDGMTPWKDIFDWREDFQTKAQILKLRKWIKKTAVSTSSLVEIQEELYDLLNDYESQMKILTKKIIKGPLETFVTIAGGVLEDILKLRFENLSSKPFIFSRRKIELAEAELKVAGREIAYLHQIRQKFSKN